MADNKIMAILDRYVQRADVIRTARALQLEDRRALRVALQLDLADEATAEAIRQAVPALAETRPEDPDAGND